MGDWEKKQQSCQHKWREMHHFENNPDGSKQLLHYCPTGFKQCSECGKCDVMGDDEKPECFKQGEP